MKAPSPISVTLWKDDIGEITAVPEGLPPNLGDTFGDNDRSETGAVLEGLPRDLGDTVGKDERREATAAVEDLLPDLDDTVGKNDRGEATAALEGTVSDPGNTLGKSDSGETTAAEESTIPNLSDTLGNGDRTEATAACEGVCGDPVDTHPFTGRDVNRKETRPVESLWKLALRGDAEVRNTPITCSRHSEVDAGQYVASTTCPYGHPPTHHSPLSSQPTVSRTSRCTLHSAGTKAESGEFRPEIYHKL